MSDLQVALIVLGVVLIGLVLGLNWWQDRRVRQRMQEDFAPHAEDPLIPGQAGRGGRKPEAAEPLRREPALGAARTGPERAEPVLGNPEPRLEPAASALAPTGQEGDDIEEPDPACEAVIDLVFPHPVPAESLLPLVRDIHQAGQKSIRVFYRTSGGVHCARLRLGVSYASMQLAVLLANRSGPLSPTEWAQAWAKAQQVADQFDAEVEGPDPREIAQHAKQLDAVCASLDTSVGLTLVARGPQPWRLAEVQAHALELGFSDQGAEHRLEWLDRSGAVCFSLMVEPRDNRRQPDTTTQLTLLLDVPRSSAGMQTPFADMAAVARELAQNLDADVVDDNGEPLQEGSEPAVDKQLRELYHSLHQHNLTAGSPRALRVFS